MIQSKYQQMTVLFLFLGMLFSCSENDQKLDNKPEEVNKSSANTEQGDHEVVVINEQPKPGNIAPVEFDCDRTSESVELQDIIEHINAMGDAYNEVIVKGTCEITSNADNIRLKNKKLTINAKEAVFETTSATKINNKIFQILEDSQVKIIGLTINGNQKGQGILIEQPSRVVLDDISIHDVAGDAIEIIGDGKPAQSMAKNDSGFSLIKKAYADDRVIPDLPPCTLVLEQPHVVNPSTLVRINGGKISNAQENALTISDHAAVDLCGPLIIENSGVYGVAVTGYSQFKIASPLNIVGTEKSGLYMDSATAVVMSELRIRNAGSEKDVVLSNRSRVYLYENGVIINRKDGWPDNAPGQPSNLFCRNNTNPVELLPIESGSDVLEQRKCSVSDIDG